MGVQKCIWRRTSMGYYSNEKDFRDLASIFKLGAPNIVIMWITLDFATIF